MALLIAPQRTEGSCIYVVSTVMPTVKAPSATENTAVSPTLAQMTWGLQPPPFDRIPAARHRRHTPTREKETGWAAQEEKKKISCPHDSGL